MNHLLSTWPYVAAMAATVLASNFLVQFPFEHLGLGEMLTWGAFTYPVAFLITDLTNRRFGARIARLVVLVGFIVAVALSIWLATPRIAIASGTAFLVAQLLDVAVFDRLRRQAWWRPPLFSTLISSALDTVLFFSIAFSVAFSFLDTSLGLQDGSLAFPVPFFGFGAEMPLWVSLAVGDFCVKLVMGFAMLGPYGAIHSLLRPAEMRS